jgi:hypothetical protein
LKTLRSVIPKLVPPVVHPLTVSKTAARDMPEGNVSLQAISLCGTMLGLVTVIDRVDELPAPAVTVDGLKDMLRVGASSDAAAGLTNKAAMSAATNDARTKIQPLRNCHMAALSWDS